MQIKTVKMIQDWSKFKKDQIVKVKDDAEGCQLVCTGVAQVHEYKASPANEPIGVQDENDHKPLK